MKHFKHLFTALLLLCCLTATAHDFEVGGIYYNITNDTNKTVEVTYKGNYNYSYSDEYTGSVVIPENVTYNGTTYSVTSIGDWAFSYCTGLTSIEIPNSVTSIGDWAFSYCTGLTSIEIPNSVTSIGNNAFKGCTGLTSIEIPNSVTNFGNYAFRGCTGLTSVVIGNSVTSIGNYAFDNCTGLTSITIPNSVTSIGNNAFYNCQVLTSITIPNSVTSIGELAFYYCSGLTSVVIPNSVTSIGKLAFFCCNNLTSVEIPNSVTSIGEDAFSRTAWYNNQPDGVVYAGKVLYKYKGTMLSNTSITIKDGTLGITDYAFSGCSGLTNIRIPNSVTRIGNWAFWDCSGLTRITVEAGNTKYDSRENCNAIIETATNTLVTGCKNSVIPNSVTRIGNWAFYKCTGLTNITIPNSITSIGKYAFLECTGLTSVEFNAENCTSMGSYDYPVFSGCTALSTVTIGENVKTIPDQAFSGCSNVETLYIGGSVASIGGGAFAGCEKITEIKVALEKPISGRANIFAEAVYDNATLYVPTGTEPLYQKLEPWNRFFYIKEMDFTGVEELKAEGGNVKAIYDLQGRVVENPENGIYIIDGKKVLVK